MLESIAEMPLKPGRASFTANGNAVKSQAAEFETGENKVSIRFNNQWNPIQTSKPDRAIKQTIEMVFYKNGQASAIRTLEERKSKSLKNAAKNYGEMLKNWKKITKQSNIHF